MQRVVLHADCNAFYASVEELYNHELRKVPMAVTGDADARHGIVLAKNQLAKGFSVKTGDALWQARQKCPDIVFVTASHGLYGKFSRAAREIYNQYTDQVEPFGADEGWLDITGSTHLFGSGEKIAHEIRRKIKHEIGLTVSVGVSFNKVFAKLGSDMKKPDAVSTITTDDYRQKVWPLAAEEMIFVGPATKKKLNSIMIRTIGDIAKQDPENLRRHLGVHGLHLWRQANGLDDSAVAASEYRREPKSIGNSTTAPHDLETENHIKITFLALCESVATQLREEGYKCRTVQISLRGTDLSWCERQGGTEFPTSNAKDMLELCMALFHRSPKYPLRSLGMRACNLVLADETDQLSVFEEHIASQKQHELETTIDYIRGRYGYETIRRGIVFFDKALDLDANSNERSNSFMQR